MAAAAFATVRCQFHRADGPRPFNPRMAMTDKKFKKFTGFEMASALSRGDNLVTDRFDE